jgi:hypothetical protein
VVFARLSRPVYLFIVILISFGTSAVAKAAQKVKKLVKGTKNNLKSSYSAYLSARAWGYFKPAWNGSVSSEWTDDATNEKDQILSDSENKIEEDFRVPRRLRGRVAFWVDVYSRFSSSYRIVHDRDNPEIIYGYIDFRPIYSAFPNRLATSKAYQIEKRILTELKGRIAEASGLENNARTQLDAGEKEQILEFLSKNNIASGERLQVALTRVRTQTGQRDFFLKAIQRSRKYLPQIEQLFRERGLPVALARLPFVESSFNAGAHSKDGAMGMWQLMPATAKLFDRHGTKRELSEPVRQSRSAARMLLLLKERLPNWGIAVTAYNSGAARLDRIVKKYRVGDIEDLIEVPASKETLGFAGKNFYCELLAANLVEAYQDKLFPPSAMKISRLALSRKVQSMIETVAFPNEPQSPSVEKASSVEKKVEKSRPNRSFHPTVATAKKSRIKAKNRSVSGRIARSRGPRVRGRV